MSSQSRLPSGDVHVYPGAYTFIAIGESRRSYGKHLIRVVVHLLRGKQAPVVVRTVVSKQPDLWVLSKGCVAAGGVSTQPKHKFHGRLEDPPSSRRVPREHWTAGRQPAAAGPIGRPVARYRRSAV